jgi:hypothetical protein
MTIWEEKTSDAYWTDAPDYAGHWDDGIPAWVSEDADESQFVDIGVVGDWSVGYRPSKIKVTFIGKAETVFLILKDSNGDVIATLVNYTSGMELPITFGDYDIARVSVSRNNTFQITKIEFGFEETAALDPIPIHNAIMTKCAGSALSTAVGGRIFCDNAPEGSDFPYVVFSIIAGYQQDTFKNKLDDMLIQFSMYSISEGLAEISAMYTHLQDLFDGQLLDLGGDTCIWVAWQNLVTMLDDITTPTGTVGLRHWSADYSVMVQYLT